MKRYKIPATPLFWACKGCGVLKRWPEYKASMYCSRKCRERVYRHGFSFSAGDPDA